MVYLHYHHKTDLYSLTSKYNKKRTGKKRISPQLRWHVWERDNFTCIYCGVRRFLTLDHKVPAAKGGTNTDSNLVTACYSCNNTKKDESYERFVTSKWLKKKRSRVQRSLIMKERRQKMNPSSNGPTTTLSSTGKDSF